MKRFLTSALMLAVLLAACIILNPSKAQAASTSDLTFTLNSDCASYSVKATSETISGELTIPASYNGKPVTTIGNYAFYFCTSLTRVTIPDSVTTIGDYAFYYCSSLTSVTIGNRVTTIGDSAFDSCALTSITIPASVTSIGKNVFGCCEELRSISVAADNPNYSNDSYGVLFNKDKTTLVAVPDGIGDTYVIPDSVTTIGDFAFAYSDAYTFSVTIPDSVTTIGDYAFYGYTFWSSITIPKSVTTIGYCAFSGFGKVLVAADNPNYSNDSYGVLFDKNKTTLIAAPSDISDSYVIPEGVTTICAGAFLDCIMTSVTIPKSVTTIGENAFYYCTYLTDVIIPEGVTTLGKRAFSFCTSLTSVTIPASVTTIDDYAFDYCRSLTDVYFSGTQEQWNAVTINSGNDYLLSATVHTDPCAKGHSWNAGTVTKKATCKATGIKTYTCSVCGGTKTETIAKLTTHTYKTTTTKATLTKKGSIVKKCTVCSKVASTTTIKYAKTFTLSATSYTYNGKVKTPTVTVKDSAGKTLVKNTDYTVTYASGRLNVGTYKVTVKGIGKYAFTKALTFKINPIKASNCAMKLSTYTYTYNGKVKAPTVTIVSPTGSTLTKGTSYTVSYESGRRNVGTYTVKVTMKGNYTGTKTQTFKIKPANLGTCKLSATSYTYNGSVKTPSVTVKNASGSTLTKGTSYTVTYASGRKNVGTYKVTIKGKGNYTGTKTLTFKINPASLGTCKLSATSYTYNGSVKTPTVTVKNASGSTLTKNTSYTVTYASGRKNVGTYKVTIKGKGNYTGTKTLTFKIVPKATSINKLTAKTKALSVKLNKQTTQTSGYEIQYATNKSFTSAKTTTVTNSTSTKTLSGLRAKTTYYVRVRAYKTVNGAKIYSGWSAAKYLKTK